MHTSNFRRVIFGLAFLFLFNLKGFTQETYPKTNYDQAFMYFQFPGQTGDAIYFTLIEQLEARGVTFLEQPPLDPEIEGDTRLLAALRMDIGTLILPRAYSEFTEKELRAMELFVIFGGRIVASSGQLGEPGTGIAELANAFAMDIDMENYLRPAEPLYVETPDNLFGMVMDIEDESLRRNFHDDHQVVLNYPRAITLIPNDSAFTAESVAKFARTDTITIARATSVLKPQKQDGYFVLISDYNIMEAYSAHVTNDLEYQAYQGGLITSANTQLIHNLIFPVNLPVDREAPVINAEFPANVAENELEVNATGTFDDIGGIAKITYQLNEGMPVVLMDAFENRAQRDEVYFTLAAYQLFHIATYELELGENSLEVCAWDQANNQTCRSYTFNYGLESTGRGMSFSSTMLGSDQVDFDMGIDLTGNGVRYPNRATSGGPLSEAFRTGGLLQPECAEGFVDDFRAKDILASAPKGAARANAMDMPETQRVLEEFNYPISSVIFHFDPLHLDDNGVIILGRGERRVYENPGDSYFTISFNETELITGGMPQMFVTLNHNAYRHCADDIITFTSGFLFTSNLDRVEGLTGRELVIANAIMTDLANAHSMRLRGTIFNSIIHDAGSEARIPGGLRYQLGVHHPDPGAFNFEGYVKLELFGQ